MDLIIVLFGLLFFSSLSIVLYERYALKLNLPTGSIMKNQVFVISAGTIPLVIFFVSAFFYIKWYWVIILFVVISQLIGFVAHLFKSWLPLVAFLVYLAAIILLFYILQQ